MNNHALFGLIIILGLSACDGGVKVSSGDKSNSEKVNGGEPLPAGGGSTDKDGISETEARRLASDFINLELKDKQFVDFGGARHPYPKFEPTSWRTAQVAEGRWVLSLDPPAGVHAKVSLSKDGGSLKLEEYGFSPQ